MSRHRVTVGTQMRCPSIFAIRKLFIAIIAINSPIFPFSCLFDVVVNIEKPEKFGQRVRRYTYNVLFTIQIIGVILRTIYCTYSVKGDP